MNEGVILEATNGAVTNEQQKQSLKMGKRMGAENDGVGGWAEGPQPNWGLLGGGAPPVKFMVVRGRNEIHII